MFKARGAQTGGSLTVFEAVNEPGQGPPYHVHNGLDEVIYVLDGALRVRLADEVQEAASGSFVFISRGIPHAWEARGDKAVRFLVVVTPRVWRVSSIALRRPGVDEPKTRSLVLAAMT